MKAGLLATCLIATTCAIAHGPCTLLASTPVPIEYQVKAAFLYRFIHFIDWPENVAPSREGSVIIGVIGEGPMHAALVSIAADEEHTQRMVIKRAEDPSEFGFCHIIFISASAASRSSEILKRLGHQSTLTVGEADGFAHSGGIVNFVIVNKVVRFEISPDAAKNANLKISSKLLRLAEIVEPDE